MLGSLLKSSPHLNTMKGYYLEGHMEVPCSIRSLTAKNDYMNCSIAILIITD